MKKWIFTAVLIWVIAVPVSASELTAPELTGEAAALMPSDDVDFADGLWYVIRTAIGQAMPTFKQGCGVCISLIACMMLLSILRTFEGKSRAAVEMCGAVAISCVLLGTVDSMISLGTETVTDISEYGKLLLPVLATALAAQGGNSGSVAIYAGTVVFDTVLAALISGVLVRMIYIYIILAIANGAFGDGMLLTLRNIMKGAVTWCLKILLYIYTGYLTITGVVSGSADQAAVKAAKLTISSAVPVVGSIMSDASEAILVSAGVVKNAVGIYGFLAVAAIVSVPFLKIGLYYGILKMTASVCGLFADKRLAALVDDFSSAMGLLLAMTGTACLLLLMSIVCFLKGM